MMLSIGAMLIGQMIAVLCVSNMHTPKMTESDTMYRSSLYGLATLQVSCFVDQQLSLSLKTLCAELHLFREISSRYQGTQNMGSFVSLGFLCR